MSTAIDQKCCDLRRFHDHVNALAYQTLPNEPTQRVLADETYRAVRSFLLDAIDVHHETVETADHHMLCPLRDPSSPYTSFTLR